MIDKETIQYIRKQPLTKIFQRLTILVVNKINRILKIEQNKKLEIPSNYSFPEIKFRFVEAEKIDLSGLDKQVIDFHIQHYLDHQIDLLGSGWIKHSYQSTALGIEKISYSSPEFSSLNKEDLLKYAVPDSSLENSTKIWSMLSPQYIPIDWQRDYKSGYRWFGQLSSKIQRNNLPIGADLKAPWELSRMQFLPQLASFATSSIENREKILLEFKNIVLDFIAVNVPGFGVNWECTMDVAIRATNILVAYDLLRQIDQWNILSNDFKSILKKSIFEHGLFIVNNLEYSPIITSNHYLSNICGLLFISSYLDEDKYTNAWLAFSIQEILNEIPKQFYPDGSNFEASTSYHRLSSEMFLYSYALMTRIIEKKKHIFNNIEKIKWPVKPSIEWNQISKIPSKISEHKLQDQLFKIGKFTSDLIKPNGEIPQFGDNDSGRFIKFSPVGNFMSNEKAEKNYHNLKGYTSHIGESNQDAYFDENILNHKPLLAAYAGIFDHDVFNTFSEEFPLEKSIVNALYRRQITKVTPATKFSPTVYVPSINKLPYSKTFTYHFEKPIEADKLEFTIYEDFGLAIFKEMDADFYLSVFFGENGQNGLGGHSHNDKLSFELYQNGNNIVVDPGTYLYTPFPEIRNKYRSVYAHNCPIHNHQEIDDFKPGRKGVFRLFNMHSCQVLNI
jgi:hypothetical protein